MLPYEKKNITLAKKLRKNMTPWERKLWFEFLRSFPVRFQRQKAIGDYIVDFYCAKAHLVIELDGSQHYNKNNIVKDKIRTEKLEGLTLKLSAFRIMKLMKISAEFASTLKRQLTGSCQVNSKNRIALFPSPPSDEGGGIRRANDGGREKRK